MVPRLLHETSMIKATLPSQDPGAVRPDAGSSADLDLRVMIVVADQSMGTFLQSFVAARGYGTIVLADAEDAIMHYEAERPAAVVLDLVSLGAMDGLDALAAFKKIDHEVPVIVLSGERSTATIVRAIKLGAADFVSK